MNLAANIFNIMVPDGIPGLSGGASPAGTTGTENGFVDFEGLLLGMVSDQKECLEELLGKPLLSDSDSETADSLFCSLKELPVKPGFETPAMTGLIVSSAIIDEQLQPVVKDAIIENDLLTSGKQNLFTMNGQPDLKNTLLTSRNNNIPVLMIQSAETVLRDDSNVSINADDILYNDNSDKTVKAQIINRLAGNLDVRQVDIMNSLKPAVQQTESLIKASTDTPKPVGFGTDPARTPDTIIPVVIRPIMTKTDTEKSETGINNSKNDAVRNENPEIKSQETVLPQAVRPVKNIDSSEKPAGELLKQPEIKFDKALSETSNNSGEQISTSLSLDSSGSDGKFHKVETPAVRFVIPSETKEGQANTRRTVIIKMEPEHLGNVRLTLSSQHDGIVGRMVVESQAARTAVESNLDKLSHELARIGLKLDSFHVSVSGGEVGGRFARHQESAAGRIPMQNDKFSAGSSVTGNVLTGISRTGTYINATGVNLLV